MSVLMLGAEVAHAGEQWRVVRLVADDLFAVRRHVWDIHHQGLLRDDQVAQRHARLHRVHNGTHCI